MTQMDRLITAVKDNPEGVLLLGAAAALILRKSASASGRSKGAARRKPSDIEQRAESPVREYVADARQKTAEFTDAATAQAKRTLRTTKSSAKRIARNQPLGLAFGGLAAGIMLAAIFPTTDIERKTLGPLGKRASDIADDAKEQVKDVAQAVGAGIKDVARESIAEVAQQIASNAGADRGQA